MFLNIFIKFFLLGLCLGEKKETVSSITFRRNNVPLSDKHRSLPEYSKDKPRHHKDRIQYAPLNPEANFFSNQADSNYPTSRHQLIEKKVPLEPRIIVKSEDNHVPQANFLQYIEGHNIIVPLKKETDNGYGQDGFSEKNKEMSQIGYDLNLSTLKQENPEPQRDLVSLKTITTTSAHIDFHKQQTMTTKEYPTKYHQVLSALENSQISPILNSYVKVPRLHLNIARAYNFAKLPVKASLIGYHKILINNPKQAFVPNIDVLLQEKTFLYPVNNNKFTLKI